MNLGFKRSELEKTVSAVIQDTPADSDLESLLRECLKKLAKF